MSRFEGESHAKRGLHINLSPKIPNIGKLEQQARDVLALIKRPPEKPETPSPITIAYEGNGSRFLEWQTEELQAFAKHADMRTATTIRNATNRTTDFGNAVQSGNLLAARNVPDIIDLFTIHSAETGLHVETNFLRGTASIDIDDQYLTRVHMEKHNGQFNPEEFAAEVNKLAKKGLMRVVNQEKRYQMFLGVLQTAYLIPPAIATLAAAYIILGGTIDAAVDYGQSLKDILQDQYSMAIHEFIKFVFLDVTRAIILGPQIKNLLIDTYFEFIASPAESTEVKKRYTTRRGDAFIPKHIINFAQGKIHLPKDIVTYAPSQL